MQHADMLPWLAPDPLTTLVSSRLGVENWRARLADPQWAFVNVNAQILLTGMNLAAWSQISPALPAPVAVAGYSVGELASFAAAGVFDGATALALAQARANAMDHCAAMAPGALMAVSALSVSQVEQICALYGIAISIENDSHALVVGGPQASLDAAAIEFDGQRARCTRLNVGLASHTRWMLPAVQEFAQVFSAEFMASSIRAPRIPLFCNAVDRVVRVDQVAQALSSQIAQTVRWSNCMENIYARRVSCVLEVGPGASLARMWNQRYPDVPARSCDEFSSVSAIAGWVLRNAND